MWAIPAQMWAIPAQMWAILAQMWAIPAQSCQRIGLLSGAACGRGGRRAARAREGAGGRKGRRGRGAPMLRRCAWCWQGGGRKGRVHGVIAALYVVCCDVQLTAQLREIGGALEEVRRATCSAAIEFNLRHSTTAYYMHCARQHTIRQCQLSMQPATMSYSICSYM